MFTKICRDDFGVTLRLAPEPLASEVLKKSKTVNEASEHTVIEAIDAVANYWKHSEEWSTSEVKRGRRLVPVWDAELKPGVQGRTIQIVTGLGLRPGSTGNLRQAAEALGVEYDNLAPIRTTLHEWADALYERAAAEVSQISGQKVS